MRRRRHNGEQLAAIWSRETAGTVVVTGEYRLGDVRHVTADCSAAEHVLGWRAETDLARGLAGLSASVVTRRADKSVKG